MTQNHNNHNEIAESVCRSLARYFSDLDGQKPAAIYQMVIKNVERPMLEFVLAQAGGNQTLAADMLGITRNTLRRKLTEYELL
ncbi:MAG: Fis family transcriptional regulator [Zoogloea sp.]|nr:Fis family transcriptional regulator [Zoogloea sp.]